MNTKWTIKESDLDQLIATSFSGLGDRFIAYGRALYNNDLRQEIFGIIVSY